MQTSIRKVGSSKGLIIPAPLLKALGLSIGSQVDANEVDGKLIIEPVKKPKYTLDELLARCDESVEMPDELNDWEQLEPVGKEV